MMYRSRSKYTCGAALHYTSPCRSRSNCTSAHHGPSRGAAAGGGHERGDDAVLHPPGDIQRALDAGRVHLELPPSPLDQLRQALLTRALVAVHVHGGEGGGGEGGACSRGEGGWGRLREYNSDTIVA